MTYFRCWAEGHPPKCDICRTHIASHVTIIFSFVASHAKLFLNTFEHALHSRTRAHFPLFPLELEHPPCPTGSLPCRLCRDGGGSSSRPRDLKGGTLTPVQDLETGELVYPHASLSLAVPVHVHFHMYSQPLSCIRCSDACLCVRNSGLLVCDACHCRTRTI